MNLAMTNRKKSLEFEMLGKVYTRYITQVPTYVFWDLNKTYLDTTLKIIFSHQTMELWKSEHHSKVTLYDFEDITIQVICLAMHFQKNSVAQKTENNPATWRQFSLYSIGEIGANLNTGPIIASAICQTIFCLAEVVKMYTVFQFGASSANAYLLLPEAHIFV